jgi:predicted TIM-barrel fold metal-dependent hydrolase
MAPAATAVPVIDADTHLTEPVDLWTARMPARFRDEAPHVTYDEVTKSWRWQIGDRLGSMVGNYSVAGWAEFPPSCPPTLEEADPAAYDAKARVAHMDANGIYAQVLYPNVIAFEGFAFMALPDEELKLACVRTYNDYQSEFASVAPDRFVLLAVLPFWDVDESIRELRRCHEMGHRGVLWASTLDKHGLPDFPDRSWDQLYDVAQDLGMSINFHVGVGETREDIETSLKAYREEYDPSNQVVRTATNFIGNARTIGKLITSGLCDRFPRLDFVSVESGFGYLPFVIDALDWQWLNSGAGRMFPERLLPSEYFRRQVYGMFWFETAALPLLPGYADNIMFETDFPHPTCLHPGPASYADPPAKVIARATEIVGDEVMRKVLYENAARVYHIDWPTTVPAS